MALFKPLLSLLQFASIIQAQVTIASKTLNSTIGYLEVSGASPCYEIHGSGPPPLLFISGAAVLQANFTIAIHDRRGFSRGYSS
ncbi:hypothetical protein K504DRAFT_506438 [Pleomassaria siparia CBS 279.74]|uniref:Alpha/beta-hydrolase n=1 Tax=Pleomassaria siparia CBS 279.74 TaxID=1314801 RepID=A0A6G1JXI2_9PLEO|nr:hypothetical protein K504DRAFT_506438 [Pleomassaria siparia CBS 279.74]